MVGTRCPDQIDCRALCRAGYLAFALIFITVNWPNSHGQTAMTLSKICSGCCCRTARVYDALKAHPQCSGKVGSVGFCFGGHMSLLLGISRPLDALCVFYGGGMQQSFDKLGALKSPVLGLFGDQDQSIRLARSKNLTSCSTRRRRA